MRNKWAYRLIIIRRLRPVWKLWPTAHLENLTAKSDPACAKIYSVSVTNANLLLFFLYLLDYTSNMLEPFDKSMIYNVTEAAHLH